MSFSTSNTQTHTALGDERGTDDDATPENDATASHGHNSSGNGRAILEFGRLCYVVGRGKKKRHILYDIDGKVESGNVLAILGPSGAGKTALINVLTLNAFWGVPSGNIYLNGMRLTQGTFKKNCFVVPKEDMHWPFLTCYETLMYSARLFNDPKECAVPAVVDEVISKMGLQSCSDVRCGKLSGGQQHRLSLAMALLKRPKVLFMDEPTTGLDAASAFHVMQEVQRIAKEEKLILVCVIHQPSSKVFDMFDQFMLLSKGREAFSGNIEDAEEHFLRIGYPMPDATNPAEFYLDLVNEEFSCGREVDKIIDSWNDRKVQKARQVKEQDRFDELNDDSSGYDAKVRKSRFSRSKKEVPIMFNRHALQTYRDPILYIGRAVVLLILSIGFAIVFFMARSFNQEQALNKVWFTLWLKAVPTQMGLGVVYAMNKDFKMVLREHKNGVASPLGFVLAKTVFAPPLMLFLSLCCVAIPGYAIQAFDPTSFIVVIPLFACCTLCYEWLADAISVLVDDPIMAMLCFISYWFFSFLFCGATVPMDDVVWPFKIFYYTTPLGFCYRSNFYAQFIDANWEKCTDPSSSFICVENGDGAEILDQIGLVYRFCSSTNTIAKDFGIALAMALIFKSIHLIAVIVKSRKVAELRPAVGEMFC